MNAFAQIPANDDPCNAFTLIATQTCSYQTFTNENATNTPGVPAPGCASYQGGDVWFKVVVPCTGNLTLDTQTGFILDGGMAVYSGTCNNLTLVDCDDDGSQNGAMSFLSLSGLTPADTVWVRIWEYGGNGNGTFGICAGIPTASTLCNSALPFCTSNTYTFPNNTGQTSLGGNGIYGCLNTTPNPVWYYMQVQSAGSLQILINQTNTSGTGIDVDFALWGPFSSFATGCSGLSASNIVDCSYSTAATETADIPNAQVGEIYILLLTNYANQPGTITFQQSGGTASSSCTVICSVTASNTGPACAGGSFNLSSSTVAGATYTWTGPNCFQLTGQTVTVPAPTIPGTYTYTVVASTPAGSACAATTTVTVTSPSTATATTTNTSCPGTPDGNITFSQSISGTYTYTLNPGNITHTSPSFPGLGQGIYSVTYTDATGCIGTLNNIVVSPGPGLSVTATSTGASCPGANNGSITATPGTPGTYTYTLNPVGTSQAGPVFTGLAGGTYSVTIDNGSSCTGTVNGIIVGAGTPITGTATSTVTSCPTANNGTVTVSPTTGTPPYTYKLDGGASQPTGLFTGVAAGAHTASFTDANGCTGTAPVTVTPGPGITGSATFTGTSCPGVNNGTITVTPATGTAPFTYKLDGGIAQPTGLFTGVASGSHTMTFTDANGCTGTTSVTVTQGTPLSGTATSTNTSCPTVNNGTVTATATSGGAPYQYSINGGALYQPSPTFTGLSPNTYTITIRDNAGCTGTVSATVSAGSNIASVIVTDSSRCANINSGIITINPSTGTAPYQYSLNGGLQQTGNVFSNLAPGAYTIAISDAIGCTGTNTANIYTNSALATTVTLVRPLCNGNNNGSITLVASGGVSPYQYSIDGGATYQGPAFTGLIAGTYTIRIKDNVGCTKDTTVTITQPAVLTASASNTTIATCAGNDGVITITAGGGTPVYQYSIDGIAFQASNVFTAPATGAYTNLTVRDANGCIKTASVIVAYADNVVLDAGPDTTICAEQSIVLKPQINPEVTIFKWTPNYAINDTSIKNPTVSPLDTTRYFVTASWGPCIHTDSINVFVKRKPVPEAGPPVTICNLDSTVLVGNATNLSGTVNYVWTPPATVRDDSSYTTIVVPPVTQTYILTVTDNYGCNYSVQDSVVVTVRPPVAAYAGHDTIAVLNQPHQLMATGGNSYVWSPAPPLSSPFSPNPLAILSNDTRFTVIVTDIAGCVGYDTVYVQVYAGPTYWTPNAFTPNGDGLNDVFRVIPVGIAKTDYFRIFNRYGQLIFETNEWLKGWDGSFKGKKQPFGVYVWIIKGTDKYGANVEMKGTVNLLQ